MENKLDLLPLLDYIDPSILDYQEWVWHGVESRRVQRERVG